MGWVSTFKKKMHLNRTAAQVNKTRLRYNGTWLYHISAHNPCNVINTMTNLIPDAGISRLTCVLCIKCSVKTPEAHFTNMV